MKELNASQLYEIGCMAEAGMALTDIGLALGFTADQWHAMQKDQAAIVDAFQSGRSNGLRVVSDTLLKSTAEGDVSAARVLLRRIEAREAEDSEAVDSRARQRIAELAAVIVPRVAKALERQRQLLSEPIECEYLELR